MPSEQSSNANPSNANSQSFTISGSDLSGNVQLGNTIGGHATQAQGDAIAAGRDVIHGGSQESITAKDVVTLLQEFESLVQSSNLPSADKEKALNYLSTATEEAQSEEPEKEFALKSFQKATKVLKDAGDTVEATTSLWEKVEGIAEKLAPWFGVAVKTLLIL